MLCQVTTNTELANTETLPVWEKNQGWVLASLWLQHLSQLSKHDLVLCVFLSKDTLFNIHC